MPTDEQDLRIDLGEARNQGARPTCLSFSLSEIHQSAINLSELLSPESLHRQATDRAKKPVDVALTIPEAFAGLSIDGQTTETFWPYDAEAPIKENCIYHQANAYTLPFSSTTVFDSLNSGQPIALIIDIDMSFFNCDGVNPLTLSKNLQIQGRHAIVICGARKTTLTHDYLIKNSWGLNWANKGHAWLTGEYILGRSPEIIRI